MGFLRGRGIQRSRSDCANGGPGALGQRAVIGRLPHRMKARPRIGTPGEMQFAVGQEHVIDFTSGGMPAVLSTPKLIGLIERTARESLYPFLSDDERTVGAEIEVRHLAPTPLGARVTITTRVIHTEAQLVDFQFE